MTSDKLALLLHLVGVVGYFAGMAAASAALAGARRRDQPAEIAAVLAVARTGVVLVGAGLLLVLVGGFWLLSELELEFGTTWLDVSIVLLVVSVVLGTIGGQAPKRARLLAASLAAADEPASPELRSLLCDRRAQALNGLAAAASLAILALMVWRPGAS